MNRALLAAMALAAILLSSGCSKESSEAAKKKAVTAYCSVDPEFAEPILAEFTKQTGVAVHHVFDTEAGKTTGLVNKLIAEKGAPRADVWWSSEIFGTIQLAELGALDAYSPKTASDVPERYRDKAGRWTAVGLRGRVIAYDPARTKKDELPRRWCDLAQPRYKGRFRMADPRFGTTRGHMATLTALWGEPVMKSYYLHLRDNGITLTDGNSQSVLQVTRGLTDFAATDTDDVIAAKLQGASIDMCYPDLEGPTGSPHISGTLWIPCSVALVKAGPNGDAARKLIDYLVSAEVESKLAASDSRNVPVRPALRAERHIDCPGEAVIDYAAAARMLDNSDRLVAEVLLK